MWSKTKLIIYTLMLSFLLAVPANADIFMRVPGVDGESDDAAHPMWIDVLSAGGNFTTNSCGEFLVTKEIDKTFPFLVARAVSGHVFSDNIVVEFTANFGGSRETFSKISLAGAQIKSISTQAGGGDSTAQVEQIAIQASSIEIVYTEYDELGSNRGSATETVICGKVK